METRTIYVPANALGRHILNYIYERVGCSIGDIKKIQNVLRVPLTLPKKDIVHLEQILQKFDIC